VDVVEPMTEDWTILEKSHEFVKKDSRTAVFSLPVPVNGETVLKYRVRVQY
jgi:ssRNA-specific RNase YbeY (16S rRNA maturation enzyme)